MLVVFNPDYFIENESTLTEISRRYSNYQGGPHEANVKLIRDLSGQLKVWNGCLIHLIIYDAIDMDLLQLDIPVVLSRYDVIHLVYNVLTKK